MKKIDIIIYSFQNKTIQNSIENIISSSSKENDIKIYLIDQNNINRGDFFKENFSEHVKYYFVNWDSIKSPIYYKEKFAKKSTAEFILHLGDSVFLEKDWDKKILFAYSNNLIFSGNSVSKIKKHKNYYLKRLPYKHSDYFQESFSIDRNFIFGLRDHLLDIGYPLYLKYYGEEEEMTIKTMKKGYKIFTVPQQLYNDRCIPLDELEYIPFSLSHNYNVFIEKNANEVNSLIKNTNKEFVEGEVFLTKVHFENNDVEYDIENSKIDKIGGDRYLNKIREIN